MDYISKLKNNSLIYSSRTYTPYNSEKEYFFGLIEKINRRSEKYDDLTVARVVNDLVRLCKKELLPDFFMKNGYKVEYIVPVPHNDEKFNNINEIIVKKICEKTGLFAINDYFSASEVPYIDIRDQYTKTNDFNISFSIKELYFKKDVIFFDLCCSTGSIFNALADIIPTKSCYFLNYGLRNDCNLLKNTCIIETNEISHEYNDYISSGFIVEIDKLFGNKNYTIDMRRNLSIIVGPNGTGKSIAYQIAALACEGSKQSLYMMSKYRFESVKIANHNYEKFSFVPEFIEANTSDWYPKNSFSVSREPGYIPGYSTLKVYENNDNLVGIFIIKHGIINIFDFLKNEYKNIFIAEIINKDNKSNIVGEIEIKADLNIKVNGYEFSFIPISIRTRLNKFCNDMDISSLEKVTEYNEFDIPNFSDVDTISDIIKHNKDKEISDYEYIKKVFNCWKRCNYKRIIIKKDVIKYEDIIPLKSRWTEQKIKDLLVDLNKEKDENFQKIQREYFYNLICKITDDEYFTLYNKIIINDLTTKRYIDKLIKQYKINVPLHDNNDYDFLQIVKNYFDLIIEKTISDKDNNGIFSVPVLYYPFTHSRYLKSKISDVNFDIEDYYNDVYENNYDHDDDVEQNVWYDPDTDLYYDDDTGEEYENYGYLKTIQEEEKKEHKIKNNSCPKYAYLKHEKLWFPNLCNVRKLSYSNFVFQNSSYEEAIHKFYNEEIDLSNLQDEYIKISGKFSRNISLKFSKLTRNNNFDNNMTSSIYKEYLDNVIPNNNDFNDNELFYFDLLNDVYTKKNYKFQKQNDTENKYSFLAGIDSFYDEIKKSKEINFWKKLECVLNKYFENKFVNIYTRTISVLDQEGNYIPLQFLSTGEKNIIILFYFCFILSFSDDALCTIIFDEPDLSLSYLWLNTLISDMLFLLNDKAKLIVLTQSPQIVSDSKIHKYIYNIESELDKGKSIKNKYIKWEEKNNG